MKTVLKWILSALMACIIMNIIIGAFVYRIPGVVQKSPIGKHYEPFGKYVSSREGYAKVIFDENGYNNEPYILEKNRSLIVALGDSYTEAMQVPREKNFCTIASQLLKNEKIVYNMGMSGNSLAEYIYYGDEIKKKYKPEWIIIEATYDDFVDDALNNNKNCYIVREKGAFQVLTQDESTAKLKEIKDTAVAFSPMIALGYVKLTSLISHINSGNRPFLPKNKKETPPGHSNDYKELISWEISEIRRIYGEDVILLYIANVPYVGNDGSVNYIEDANAINIKNEVYKNCTEQGIEFMDMTDDFNNEYITNKRFVRGFSNTLPGQGHLNKTGHDLIGNKLADFINNREAN